MTNMPSISLILTFSIITGLIAAYVAKEKKGRPPIFWFGMGFMLGLSALVALLFLPSLKKSKDIAKAPLSASEEKETSLAPIQKLPMEGTFWYYLTEKEEQKGPITFEALKRLYRNQEVAESSYVWNELMQSWDTLSQLPDYLAVLEKEKA